MRPSPAAVDTLQLRAGAGGRYKIKPMNQLLSAVACDREGSVWPQPSPELQDPSRLLPQFSAITTTFHRIAPEEQKLKKNRIFLQMTDVRICWNRSRSKLA